MSKKVFLGVDHGGSDPGAVGFLIEKDINLNMAIACRDFLVQNGVNVRMSRTKDENDPLTEVIKECNNFVPDLAVDIHNNAGKGDSLEFTTPSVEATIFEDINGDWEKHNIFDTEEAANAGLTALFVQPAPQE